MVTYPKEGRKKLLAEKMANSSNWRVKLFTVPTALSLDTVYTDLTEANFSGYTDQTPSWGTIGIDGSNRAYSDASSMTFSHSGGATSNVVYGYALVDVGASKLLFADLLPGGPKTMAVLGDSITITPTMTEEQGS